MLKTKCEECQNSLLSDERDVGCGFVPFCRKGHWYGDCEEDHSDLIVIYHGWDDCKDFELLEE